MNYTRIKVAAVLLVASISVVGINGCKALKDVANSLTAFQKLQFKLGDSDNFKVNGIAIDKVRQPSDLSFTDAAKLTAMFAQKKFPVSFRLNLLAKNPNDGTAGTKSTPLFIKRLAWTLSIDDRTTVNGVVDKRLEIPGSGQTATIPMDLELDLYKFFSDKGYNDLINLALAVGGVEGSSSRLKLTAQVRVETPVGDIDYPGDLTIVDHQFTSK